MVGKKQQKTAPREVTFDMYPADSVFGPDDIKNVLENDAEFEAWQCHDGEQAVVHDEGDGLGHVSITFADGYVMDGLSDVHVETVVDVYIKDEGYADIKFQTTRAKEVAHGLGLPNALAKIGEFFCGKRVWNEKLRIGLYTCGIKLGNLKEVVADLEAQGLTVENEFNLANI